MSHEQSTQVGWYRDADGRQCWWTPNEPFTHGQPVGDIKPPDFHMVPRVRAPKKTYHFRLRLFGKTLFEGEWDA